MWFHKILDPHLHEWPVARDELLVKRVTQVDPEILAILVDVTQTKVISFQNSQCLTYLSTVQANKQNSVKLQSYTVQQFDNYDIPIITTNMHKYTLCSARLDL